MPREVWAPASERELALALRQANEDGLAVVPVGHRTKSDFAAPPRRVDVVLDCSALPEFCDHAADDLVVRASTSISLGALGEALAVANQRLSIDEVVPGSTLGGVVGTGLAGPLRFRYGAPRDLLLGVRFALADGTVAKAGSRVVKNVAGFDLAKLLCGSYGTLAVVTETIWRLHPRPQATSYLLVPGDPVALAAAALRLARSPLAPSGIELDAGSSGAELAVAFEGFAAGLPARAERAAALLGGAARTSDAPPSFWGRLPDGVLLRVGVPPARAAGFLEHCIDLGVPWRLRGSIALGSLVLGLAVGDREALAKVLLELRASVEAMGGSVVILAAAAELVAGLDRYGTVRGEDLMRRVKARFDPAGTLAPGRFLGDR